MDRIINQLIYDRVVNFLLIKTLFLGALIQSDLRELLIWTSWFAITGYLRIFALLCRDRFEYVGGFPPLSGSLGVWLTDSLSSPPLPPPSLLFLRIPH